MKPRMHVPLAIFVIAAISLFFACSKDNSNSSSTGTANQTTVQTQADDQAMVSNETDNLTNDATSSLSSQASINGSSVGRQLMAGNVTVLDVSPAMHTEGTGAGIILDSLICDATVVVDTTVSPRTITITYNGTNCAGNRTRTGSVVISIPAGTYWENAGATVSINVQNLTITRLSDSKTITINGHRILTNVSGGSLLNLANLQSITHSISDSLTIAFPNNTSRSWQVSKQRVFTYNNGIVITTTGTHSDNNYSNIAEWGTNRFGTAFESLITQPKVIRQDCSFRLVSGQNEILRSDSLNSTITYGLDATGNPTSCPGTGNFYYQVIWSFPNGTTVPIIAPY